MVKKNKQSSVPMMIPPQQPPRSPPHRWDTSHTGRNSLYIFLKFIEPANTYWQLQMLIRNIFTSALTLILQRVFIVRLFVDANTHDLAHSVGAAFSSAFSASSCAHQSMLPAWASGCFTLTFTVTPDDTEWVFGSSSDVSEDWKHHVLYDFPSQVLRI